MAAVRFSACAPATPGLSSARVSFHVAITQPIRPLQRRQRRGLRASVTSSSMGFNLGSDPPEESPERQAEGLQRAAASLLLYQGVLRGATAKAFLQVLAHLQKGSPVRLLEHYGELYCTLAAEGHASWQDYLLEQVLRSSDSPLARAAAKGEPYDHLLPAARHDLDVLQSLAVTESKLAGWVRSAANASDTWVEAACSLRPGRGAGAGAPTEAVSIPEHAPVMALPPLSEAQRAELRAEVAGRERWGEAAVLLAQYHAAHGYGLVSMHRVLKWTGTSLQADDLRKGYELPAEFEAARGPATLGVVADTRTILEPLCRGDPPAAPEVDINPQGYGAVLWRICASPPDGLRIVVLPTDKASSLAELAWALGHHPRVAFAVFCPSTPRSVQHMGATITAFSTGHGWPTNAVLINGQLDQLAGRATAD